MKTDPAQLLLNLRTTSRPDGLAVTGTLLALSQLAAPVAVAQEEKKDENKKPEELAELVVDANQEKKLYKPERLQSPKVTQPLRDVAKTITVIPTEVMKAQNATNLRDVLRNVPGISMQAGEGGGGPAGDNLSIRGFSSRSDIFVDGMRDTAGGGYSRDPFNFEQVEVTKGPSSTTTGRGSTGGSINIVTKTPHLDNGYNFNLGGGTDDYFRGTFDVNQEIPNLNGVAVRLNGLYHDQMIPGRDYVENERWGIAPSIAFGLGTDTRFTLNYMHLDQDNVPDYGIPWVARTSTNPMLPPGIPYGVGFDSYYGNLNRDYEKTITDILTGTFEHDFNEDLKLRSTLRYGHNVRDSVTTAPRFVNVNTSPILNQQFQSRDQTDESYYSQTDLRYDFNTGTVEHQVVGGLELGREDSINHGRTAYNLDGTPVTTAQTPQTNLWFPNPFGDPDLAIRNGSFTETSSDIVALYLFDTITINKNWEVNGGLRWDYYDTDYTSRTTAGVITPLQRDDSMLSYQAAVTYKPVEEGSIYLSYGTSFNPSTENLTYIAAPTGTNNTLSLFQADPEENETVELGAKWEFFDEKLLVSGAVFRTEKTNARTTDPADPSVVTLTGEQVVKGFEFGVTGQITDKWSITGGYTYLDGEVKESAVPAEVGSELSNTPENSFSIWTDYVLPAGFNVGAGAQFVDSRFNNNNETTRQTAPSFTIFNAMVGYQATENLSLQLNINNLTDEDYIDRVGGGHFVPGAGRSAVLSATMTF
ncbi:TonB-dependent receptor [Luteolibacter luteus]|uniref:TonB-dependent siderophore receptor n=1 Tax=Luteolibacter luteus TaxID=2728835 RepID=A0A858RDH4_9BACT|nr:TonB-dependent siderophore receptor [Luteolibacter luteus]QJE94681.1 TonB-dependent siderophore receptor [Luteolibacter luteus]